MLKKFKGLLVEEQGQGMTEYGLILGAIAAVVVAFTVLFGPRITTMFTNAVNTIQPAP